MLSLFPISKTKITPPRRKAEMITRPRLIETLHSLLNKKLTLISAPAGYGKTSLLIDLVDKSEIPVCWLSLDILDQEPQRFLSYLIACIQKRFPSFGAESRTMLSNAASIEKENERLAVVLTNEIYQDIHEHFAIVLDDYQFIDPVPEISLFINRFVQLAGEHCHLILASRTLPSLADLHLLVARDQVGGMSLEDLAFLPEEIQAFFAQNSAQRLSLAEAHAIAEKTDGWITSIYLTGLSSRKGDSQSGTSAARSGIELYDYFTREVLEKQSPDMREFLLLTSLFDEVDIELCRAVLDPLLVTHRQDWKSLINTVQKNNLFVIPLGTDGHSFRYHHLFQDYLQAKLQDENPTIVQQVMLNLALFYRVRQDWEKAHYIYENIHEQAALVNLIEEAGTFFIQNGRIATLGNWLDRLPISLLQQNPRILSLLGAVSYTRGEAQSGISMLSQAEKALRVNQDLEFLAVTLVRRAAVYRELGNYTSSLADADEAIELSENSTNGIFQDTLAEAQRVKGLSLFRLGKTAEALTWLESSLRLFSSLGDNAHIPILEMEMGALYYTLGNDEAAIKFYRSALKTWEATGNLVWQATLMNNLGVLYHYRGEYEKSFQVLEHAIECAKRSGYARAQASALSSLGDLLADLQELQQSEECFDQALMLAHQLGYSFLIFYSSVAKIRSARLGNHLVLADTLLQDLLGQMQQHTSPTEEALFRLEYGCLLLYTNQADRAADEMAQAVSLYEQDNRVMEVCTGKLWLAAALIASGQIDPGIVQLQELFSTYRTLKEPNPLHITAGEVHPWLKNFNSPADLKAPLLNLFSRAEKFAKSIPTIRGRIRRVSKLSFISPPHLVIHALGPAQVISNEKEISLSDWQTRETRDLFFFFLQSDALTKEEIADAFWPDISPARLKMRFKTNIYRLRHAVGQNTILYDGERYRFNHDVDYEYDLDTFNDLVEQANLAKNVADCATFLQTAIELVRGPFLANIDTDWAFSERRRIELQYQSVLTRLAGLYLEMGQATRALEVCQITLNIDPLIEETYRLSMRAYALMGDQAAAARIFQTCSDVLNEELGVKPSKETVLLYKQLI